MKSVLIKYITKNFLRAFIIVFFCFYIIIAILDMMDVVRQYYSGGYNPSISLVLKITVCRALLNMTQFFPFITLMASIIFYLTMHNKLELTIIKGTGISTYKLLGFIFIAIAFLSITYITIFDTMSVYSYRYLKTTNINIKYNSQLNENLTVTNKGIWFRDTFEKNSYIVFARGFDPTGTALFNVRVYEFDGCGDLKTSIIAKNATIADGNWRIANCKLITKDGNSAIKAECKLPTKLSYKKINRMVTNPKNVSFWSIKKYVGMLENVGLSSISYQMHWFSRIAAILQMFAFAALATAFCIEKNIRDGSSYTKKLALLLALAFPLHFINNVVIAYGTNGTLPLPMAMLALPITILLTGLLSLKGK